MTSDISPRPISPLRARMIEDMTVRGFNEHTQRDYVRHLRSFAAFISRSPDTASPEDPRLFQLHQTRTGMQPPSITAVSALRFFFTVTLDRPIWRVGLRSFRIRGGYRRCSASRR
jgi:integrase/recombinase XerD